MKFHNAYTNKIFTITFFCICMLIKFAQAQTSPFISLTYKDSLLADEKSFFVYNHVNIVNTFNQIISFKCIVNVPDGWKTLSENNLFIELAPGESYPLNITLNRSKTAPAVWKEAQIKIILKNNPDTNSYSFYLKAGIIKNFRASTVIKELTVNDETQYVDLPVRILNSGNTKVEYKLHFYNYMLQLDDNVKFYLSPAKDTFYHHRIWFPKRIKKNFVNEKVFLNISEKDGKTALYSYDILRTTSFRKVHTSAFTTFPVIVSSGIFMYNKKVSGYFGLNAVYSLKNDDKILFGYRSRQLGTTGLQRDIFNIGFLHKKWSFYGGQMNELGIFYNNGNGLKAIYKKNDSTSFGGHIIKSHRLGVEGTNIGLWGSYKKGKIIFFNELLANYDKTAFINAYVENNKIIFANNKKVFFDVNAGVGYMKNTSRFAKNNQTMYGYSAGYHFSYNLKKIILKSNVEYNNDGFPGVYQGYRMQSHDVRWLPIKKFNIGAQYQSSYYKRNFFRDSIYYKSKLLSNMRQYGLLTGLNLKSIGINLSGGFLTNAVQENYTAPVYKYGSAGVSFSIFKKLNFVINRTEGYQKNYGPLKRNISLHTTNAGIMTKWAGVQYMEDHLPVFGYINNVQDFTGYLDVKTYGPFINKDFTKLNLQLRLQYNYSITTPDTTIQQNATVSANYTNQKSGLTLELTGSMSIHSKYKNQYIFLTLNKPFNIAVPKSRKYYNLTLHLFNDKNNNGIKEKDEFPLSNATVLINDHPYTTSKTGAINIVNTDIGVYTLDFHNIQSKEGIIPAKGFKQSIAVSRKMDEFIPFKKGKTIKGNITVILDSLSRQKFSSDYLKVIVTDSTGDKFTTLSDANGNFSIGVPAGKYIVSLNPQAFDDVFRPVQIAFTADVSNNEEANVYFQIKQRQRKLIMIKANGTK